MSTQDPHVVVALGLLLPLAVLLLLMWRILRRRRLKLRTGILCSNCGHENRRGARFCHVCGTALALPGSAAADVPLQHTKPLARDAGSKSPSPALPATRPLPEVGAAFTPLPEGTLLCKGRYRVVERRAANVQSNLYLVEDTALVRPCPNCQTAASDPQERFCSLCGADLSAVEPLHLHYLMRESDDDQAFAVEAQLLDMNLNHPGLLLPHAFFAEAPHGLSRYCLVESRFPPKAATTLPVPQKLNQVLGWGVSLAQALDYLHRHHITLREVGLKNIAIDGRTASWTHLGAAYVIPPEARPAAASYFAQDVHGLAETLLFLATGQQQYNGNVPLPEQVARPFSQAIVEPTGLSAVAFAAALQELCRPTSVTFHIGQRTYVGQERSLNEDSLLTLEIAPVFRSVGMPVGLFVVADGMGGHEAGDLASRLAVQTVARQAVSEVLMPSATGVQLPNARQWLTAATVAANQAVYEQRRAAGTDMGTTLVMALLIGDDATIVNVGDSRAYQLSPQGIKQITTDHSLVERLIAAGQLTQGEAADHPQRNVIYRVVGDKAKVDVDLFEQQLAPGEALLLCSDGLSGMVPDEQIWQIWRASISPQEACDRLVDAANHAGGKDNISVVIVQVPVAHAHAHGGRQ